VTAIRQVVARYLAPPALAGGEAVGLDRSAVQRELASVRRSREIAFWLAAMSLVVIFTMSVAFMISQRDHPEAIKTASMATGITITGVIAAMTKLWQDRVKADLVIALVSGMSEDALKDALMHLVAKL
jgi:hypothetical protein